MDGWRGRGGGIGGIEGYKVGIEGIVLRRYKRYRRGRGRYRGEYKRVYLSMLCNTGIGSDMLKS